MINRSTTELSFEHDVAAVLSEIGEIFCVILFSYAAGLRSFEFFRDLESFRHRLRELPSRTSVVVFRDPQLPLRGIVDDEFVVEAKRWFMENHWIRKKHWMVACMSMVTMGRASWFHHTDGSSLDELEEELRDGFCWGQPVAVGEEPNWFDLKRTFDAIVPEPDGRVIIGAY